MEIFTEIELFNLLKNAISDRFLQKNFASTKDISQWKGQEITNFQEDLLQNMRTTVSEKWFYTYFKSDFKKLPRIDMLNLLAEYCGYSGWADFVYQNEQLAQRELNNGSEILISPINIIRGEEKTEENIPSISEKAEEKIASEDELDLQEEQSIKPKKNRLPIFITLGVILLMAVGYSSYYLFFRQKQYKFCFIDADRNVPILNNIEVTILKKGFSPTYINTNNGCIQFYSYEDTLKMLVNSPLHKLDSFKINLHQYNGEEKIPLIPDDYKVMLSYYSKSSKGVKERISKLDKMIADNALIYQVYDNDYFGVEILSKQQYINLVSLPTTSLKNYSLIESEMKNGKIVKIKFKIQSDEKETPKNDSLK